MSGLIGGNVKWPKGFKSVVVSWGALNTVEVYNLRYNIRRGQEFQNGGC